MKIFNKIPLFWVLQISGWLILNLIYVILYYRNLITDLQAMFSLFLTYFTGFFVSLLLREIYRRTNCQNRSIPIIAVIILCSSLVSANIWLWIDRYLTIMFYGIESLRVDMNINTYSSTVWSHTFVLLLWSALYFSIKFWQDWNDEKLRAEKANSLAHSAQLQMLRYQLNPHFLFNSLNSIRALVEEDKTRAKSMITELSEFLRYSLVSKNYSDVPLKSELDAIRHYLEIEKTRYEEKLQVEYDVDEDAEEFPVLSFLIHPLVENAIKYGMKTSKMPLTINLSAKLKNDNLLVSVQNSGKWINENDSNTRKEYSTGTGLVNVKQRLENAFPERHKFNIIKNDNHVLIELEIFNS